MFVSLSPSFTIIVDFLSRAIILQSVMIILQTDIPPVHHSALVLQFPSPSPRRPQPCPISRKRQRKVSVFFLSADTSQFDFYYLRSTSFPPPLPLFPLPGDIALFPFPPPPACADPPLFSSVSPPLSLLPIAFITLSCVHLLRLALPSPPVSPLARPTPRHLLPSTQSLPSKLSPLPTACDFVVGTLGGCGVASIRSPRSLFSFRSFPSSFLRSFLCPHPLGR